MTIIRLFLLYHRLPKSLADHRCQSNATPIQVVVYRTGNECLGVIVGTPAALGELKRMVKIVEINIYLNISETALKLIENGTIKFPSDKLIENICKTKGMRNTEKLQYVLLRLKNIYKITRLKDLKNEWLFV